MALPFAARHDEHVIDPVLMEKVLEELDAFEPVGLRQAKKDAVGVQEKDARTN
jgi:hypothetical protein